MSDLSSRVSIERESREPRWLPAPRVLRARLPSALREWLLDESSLTARVTAACAGRFRVEVLNQGWARPQCNEARALGLACGQRAMVRQVYLLCDERPWVFARTIIPVSTLTGAQRRLAHLGSRPLGAVLFADPGMHRGVLQLARIAPGDRLFATATARLRRQSAAIYGRRSVFRLDDKPLLVSEIFLPEVGQCARRRAPR